MSGTALSAVAVAGFPVVLPRSSGWRAGHAFPLPPCPDLISVELCEGLMNIDVAKPCGGTDA